MANDYVKGLLSGGEVVLIDTRQHWMAAIRYALKPILLVGAIVLLALVSTWLPGWLDFMGQIIRWILVIMVIVAVIWMPYNLVQWYSRKYVLTNRRAMRMSGILRKTSFDSSLEQINDIAMEQSFFGRQLGYADLTLFTASDTANEQYQQLMDGLQFKKAVLDAKEAIRHGHPLTALAAGFIVKGGTNEASMRADGKIEKAAAQAAPTAEGATAVAATTSPAAAAEPETVIEPEPVTASAPAPAVEQEPEPIEAPAVEAAAEAQDDAAPAPEPEAAPEAEPEAAPEAEPEAVPEAEPEAVPEAEPEAVPEAAAEPTPESEPEPDANDSRLS